MVKGQFSAEQHAHIESFYPDFVKEMDKGVSGMDLTCWKQTKASNILDSPLFLTLDFTKFPRKTWFEMIVRKFTNYRNQIYLKSESASTATTSVAQVKKANPLLRFSSLMTGRELFAVDNYESILHAAKQRASDTNSKNLAAAYQTVLKEQWDALSGEDQAHWNELAEAQGGDIGKNQREFATNLTLALRDLCQGKLLGDAEMLLFYGFRDSNGDLIAGTQPTFSVQAHSVHNHVHFGGTPEEQQLHHGKAWADFAEQVIPRPVISNPNPSLPRNSNNQPVFPSIDINTMPIADMRILLADYFDLCWAHQSPGVKLPWESITSDPAKYYDVSETYFSIKLDHPQNLLTMQILTLVDGLLSSSTLPLLARSRRLKTSHIIPVSESPPAPLPNPILEVPEPPPALPAALAPIRGGKRRVGGNTESADDNKAPKKRKLQANSAPETRTSTRSRKPKKTTDAFAAAKSKLQPPAKKRRWRGYAEVDEDGNEVWAE
ncbi:hypothetical protein C8F04DRAFT_1194151 [Mycena alexandri]|uniref:Uncharacterized protein n=1 Tax=Mycena alexandri TaxID=1745969 RepID=A0AAD6S7X8_9AGAR|nr:hypothetical protein C8F04DRAFT_1194151 [Mycena alexandri]